MFGLFKSSKGKLYATQDGQILSMEQVPDEMFSEKMLGDGFAILPSGENVYSPTEGEVVSIYEGSNHCYAIRATDGLEILIHIGIETVSLKNNAITPKVTVGQKIKTGELIAHVDTEKIKAENLSLHTMVVITNMNKIKSFEIIKKVKVSHGEEAFVYELI